MYSILDIEYWINVGQKSLERVKPVREDGKMVRAFALATIEQGYFQEQEQEDLLNPFGDIETAKLFSTYLAAYTKCKTLAETVSLFTVIVEVYDLGKKCYGYDHRSITNDYSEMNLDRFSKVKRLSEQHQKEELAKYSDKEFECPICKLRKTKSTKTDDHLYMNHCDTPRCPSTIMYNLANHPAVLAKTTQTIELIKYDFDFSHGHKKYFQHFREYARSIDLYSVVSKSWYEQYKKVSQYDSLEVYDYDPTKKDQYTNIGIVPTWLHYVGARNGQHHYGVVITPDKDIQSQLRFFSTNLPEILFFRNYHLNDRGRNQYKAMKKADLLKTANTLKKAVRDLSLFTETSKKDSMLDFMEEWGIVHCKEDEVF